MKIKLHTFLFSAQKVNGQLKSLIEFIPTDRAPDTHWIEGWEDHRTVLEVVVKRKYQCLFRESNQGRSDRYSSIYCLRHHNIIIQ